MPKLGDLIKRSRPLASQFQRKHLKPKVQQKFPRVIKKDQLTEWQEFVNEKLESGS